jgi:hypothetical protein
MRLVPIALVVALATASSAAAAPSNDDLRDAQRLGDLPARVGGTTRDAGTERSEPRTRCGATSGTVWYALRSDRRGPLIVQLEAAGALQAVVGVFRRGRGDRLQPVACRRTNVNGRVLLAFYGRRGREYAVVVGTAAGSRPDAFRLDVSRPEPRSIPPGRPLAGPADATVHPLLDRDDAWSVELERGRSYRINLLPARDCVSAYLYRPRTYRFTDDEQPVAALECGGYALFTPGPDGGGRYSLLVVAEEERRAPQRYVLRVAPAEADDVAPGIDLGASADVDGSLSGRGVDLLDLYRFRAGHESELDVRLRTSPKARFQLVIVRPTGEPVQTEARQRPGRTVLRHRLDAGHYYLGVRSLARSGGPYSLSLRVRGITATDMLVGNQRFLQVAPGEPQALAATVAAAGIGGRVRFQFDRRDPFNGWQFAHTVVAPVGATGLATASWTPPGFGHWRVRARFLGTDTEAPSESGYTRIFVAEPLDTG